MNETELYRSSLSFAVENKEKDLWLESYRANRDCAEFIRQTLADGFDGMHLDADCARKILDAYGFDRVTQIRATFRLDNL